MNQKILFFLKKFTFNFDILKLINKSKYIIIFLIIISTFFNNYLNDSFQKTYKLKSYSYSDYYQNLKPLHKKFNIYQDHLFKKFTALEPIKYFDLYINDEFKLIYKEDFLEFVNLFLDFIDDQLVYNFYKTNIKRKDNLSHTYTSLNDLNKYTLDKPVFIIEMYGNISEEKLIEDFKKTISVVDQAYKNYLIQVLENINQEINIYMDSNNLFYDYLFHNKINPEDLDYNDNIYRLRFDYLKIILESELYSLNNLVNFLQNDIDNLTSRNITYQISISEYPYYIYLIYMYIFSIILGTIIQIIVIFIRSK